MPAKTFTDAVDEQCAKAKSDGVKAALLALKVADPKEVLPALKAIIAAVEHSKDQDAAAAADQVLNPSPAKTEVQKQLSGQWGDRTGSRTSTRTRVTPRR